MAFNEQNREDAYKFFVLTFNAVPGAKHAVDVVNAYNAGLTTAEIIEIYTSKDAFKAIYADSLTSKEFAEKLVANVAAASTSVAAKTAAVNDIVKAMEGGMTKGGVIYQVLGNLSNKPVTDLDWGTTVAKLNNKVEVAKALTEGAKALQATDVATLQAAIAGVTEDAATIQQALDKSSVLATKLENLSAANKAKAAFAAALDQDADGKADGIKVSDVDAKVNAAVDAETGSKGAALDAQLGLTAGDKIFSALASATEAKTTEAQKAAALEKGKTAITDEVADKKVALAAAELAANTDATTPVSTSELAQFEALKAAYSTALEQSAVAYAAQAAAITKITTLPADPAITATVAITDALTPSGTTDKITVENLAGMSSVEITFNTSTKSFNVPANVLAALTNAAEKSALVELVAAVNKLVGSVAPVKSAADALKTWGVTSSASDTVEPDGTDGKVKSNLNFATGKAKLAEDVVAAKLDVAASNQKFAALDAAITAYNKAVADKAQLKLLNDAITTAKKSFTDSGLTLPIELTEGLAVATGADDTFLAVAEKSQVTGFGSVGKDSIYIGSGYGKGADFAKGDDTKLEVFFKANGADTDVYVEQKVFGSNVNGAAAGNKDIFKITLTGVAADKLVLSNDGFITLA